jgi:hypothetical protein
MDFLKINKIIRDKIPEAKIIFSSDFLVSHKKKPTFLEKDIFIVFDNYLSFRKKTKDKESFFELKKQIQKELQTESIHLYFCSREMLFIGFYHVDGFYFKKNGKRKTIFYKGDKKIVDLFRIKSCLRCLILYKLEKNAEEAEKCFFYLQKMFFLLTGEHSDDLEKIENDVETLAKEKIKNRNLKGQIFYSLKFKKIFSLYFEQNIVDCLLDLKRFINTDDQNYAEKFFDSYSRLENIEGREDHSPEIMFELISKYIFLIFIV